MPAPKSPKAPKVSYRCTECGWSSPKRMGQCREYREWGAPEGVQVSDSPGGGAGGALGAAGAVRPTVAARPIEEVSVTEVRARPAEVGEPDRVLSGGIVSSAVALPAGEPGAGKSTLLLDVAAKAAAVARERGDGPVLYITGGESTSQVRLRAERIDALDLGLFLVAETELDILLGHVEAAGPSLLVVDSVQTIVSAQVEGSAGGVTQVWAVASVLIAVAKERNIPVLFVGHVIRDGGIAGPRVPGYLVDVATQFEGDRRARLRLLRVVKNRYGPTDEVGCFNLGERGIVGFADPLDLFLSAARSEVPGICATVTLEERRPMPVGIQALVAPTNAGSPHHTTSGADHSRTAMALAVLSTRLRVDTSSADVYVSTVDGARAIEPVTDLAVATPVASTVRSLPTPAGLVAFSETGLIGEVRATVGIQRRLAEASRFGFDQAIVSLVGSAELCEVVGMQALSVAHMDETMGVALPCG